MVLPRSYSNGINAVTDGVVVRNVTDVTNDTQSQKLLRVNDFFQAAKEYADAVNAAVTPDNSNVTGTLSPGHTVVWREDFNSNQTTWTNSAKGNMVGTVTGTFNRVPVGMRLSNNHPTGFSTTGTEASSYIFCPIVGELDSQVTERGLIGQWVWVDTDRIFNSYQSATTLQVGFLQGNIFNGGGFLRLGIRNDSKLAFEYSQDSGQDVAVDMPRRQWVYLGYAYEGLSTTVVRHRIFMYVPRTNTKTIIKDIQLNAQIFNGVYVGSIRYSPQTFVRPIRVSGIGRYLRAAGDFAVVHPAEWVLPPSPKDVTYYVNPSTGDDANDGVTAPWETAAKLVDVQNKYGILPSDEELLIASQPGLGSTIIIDTSAAKLPLPDSAELRFTAHDIRVIPATGQSQIKIQAEEVLPNTGWTNVSGNIYKIACTDALIHVWDVKSEENPMPYTRVANAAAVNAAGKQAVESNELYVWFYGNGNPNSDGVKRVRSINRSYYAVVFAGYNQYAKGFKVWYTAEESDEIGCVSDDAGFGGNALFEDFDVRFGAKHCHKWVASTANSVVVFRRWRGEQCYSPGVGGATTFVSFMDTQSNVYGGNVHRYENCRCDAALMVAGSIYGTNNANAAAWLCHNEGSGFTAFDAIYLDDCNFPGVTTNQGNTDLLSINRGAHIISNYANTVATQVDLRGAPFENAGTLALIECTRNY